MLFCIISEYQADFQPSVAFINISDWYELVYCLNSKYPAPSGKGNGLNLEWFDTGAPETGRVLGLVIFHLRQTIHLVAVQPLKGSFNTTSLKKIKRKKPSRETVTYMSNQEENLPARCVWVRLHHRRYL